MDGPGVLREDPDSPLALGVGRDGDGHALPLDRVADVNPIRENRLGLEGPARTERLRNKSGVSKARGREG